MQAPELEVPIWIDEDGIDTSFSLAENRGKWIIINCFQHWCEGCHTHGLPSLLKIATTFTANTSIEVICIQTVFEGFETNTQERLRETQLRYNLPVIMGHEAGDPDGETLPTTMQNYKTGGTPWMILIQPDGEVVFSEFTVNVDNLIEFLTRETS